MTDMSNYHISDHNISTMSVSQLLRYKSDIIDNISTARLKCEGTLMTIAEFTRLEASETRKIKAINRRIAMLQNDPNAEYHTMTDCADCGRSIYVHETVAYERGFVCYQCVGVA